MPEETVEEQKTKVGDGGLSAPEISANKLACRKAVGEKKPGESISFYVLSFLGTWLVGWLGSACLWILVLSVGVYMCEHFHVKARCQHWKSFLRFRDLLL